MGHAAAKSTFPILLVLLLVLSGCAAAPRLQSNFCTSDHEIALAPAVTDAIAEATYLFEQNPDAPAAAIAPLDRVIAACGRRLAGLSKAKAYEKRGQLKAQNNDIDGAISDYETALATEALPFNEANGLSARIATLAYPTKRYDPLEDVLYPDRNAEPLVQVAPIYPEECKTDAAPEEIVTIEFDVLPHGLTTNITVIESTNECFNDAAKRSIGRWKFQPKIMDNVARWRRGVITKVTFNFPPKKQPDPITMQQLRNMEKQGKFPE